MKERNEKPLIDESMFSIFPFVSETDASESYIFICNEVATFLVPYILSDHHIT